MKKNKTRLFVGNVPSKTNENELRTAFATYGDITNLELKSKPASDNEANKFAFITISTTHSNIESCIQSFSNTDFNGTHLYVTRARESFLERLERERAEELMKNAAKNETPKLAKGQPVMKINDKLNPRKRKSENQKPVNGFSHSQTAPKIQIDDQKSNLSEGNQKKQDSDKKRLESLRQKRQDFKQKQMIIKTGLVGIDKVPNKKVIFSDNEDAIETEGNKSVKSNKINVNKKQKALFEDEDSDNDVNFEIKEQFEGNKGQKVLELQSRYKSDKRFKLDERFIEEDPEAEGVQGGYEKDHEAIENGEPEDDRIECGHTDEKAKQLNILQDVLGFTIKAHHDPDKETKKTKSKLGMLRFDPLEPNHAKFLAPVDVSKQDALKKGKKKKQKEEVPVEPIPLPQPEQTIEVSKEQFYKVTDTLKEAIAQPNTFSLRSLFKRDDDDENNQDKQEDEDSYIPLHKPKDPKVKNPLDPGSKNPFKYDSSDSESEEDDAPKVDVEAPAEPKAVWREKLFFSDNDTRLEEGLAFFNKTSGSAVKERRELKSVMKKRIYNKERKEQMFKKKIGGRRKSFKKSHRKKN